MVGNDIIDLENTKYSGNSLTKGWKRPGFIEKIFSDYEQELISNSRDSFITIWRLWSMKESAYKIFIQSGGKPFFNPKKIECQLEDLNGLVEIENLNIQSKSIINDRFIFTVAGIENLNFKSQILDIGNNPQLHSENLKKRLLHDFSEEHNLVKEKLRIEKIRNGIPRMFYDGEDLGWAISLTHCGKFGGFSYKNE